MHHVSRAVQIVLGTGDAPGIVQFQPHLLGQFALASGEGVLAPVHAAAGGHPRARAIGMTDQQQPPRPITRQHPAAGEAWAGNAPPDFACGMGDPQARPVQGRRKQAG